MKRGSSTFDGRGPKTWDRSEFPVSSSRRSPFATNHGSAPAERTRAVADHGHKVRSRDGTARGSFTCGAFAALLCCASSSAWAEPSAIEIARAALDNNMFSEKNARATIDLDISKDGKTVRSRQISAIFKRKDGLVRSFVEFVTPADVAGTKFLSLEVAKGENEQYIYLPAFKKVKRVVGAEKGKSFMGTDFSYADLEGRDAGQAAWGRLADDKVQGEDCFVVEGRPTSPDKEEYGKTVIWVHKKHMIPLKSEFYDKAAGTVIKRMLVHKLIQKDGKWVAEESVMETLKKSTQTRLKLRSIDFKTEVPEEALSKEALER